MSIQSMIHEARVPYPVLEFGKVSRAQSISFGNDWNQIDSRAQSLHNFNVKGLESVASRADEVQASMDSQVNLLRPTGLLLLQHVGFMLVIKELDNGLPRVAVVDIVAKARGIDNSKADWTLVRSKLHQHRTCASYP